MKGMNKGSGTRSGLLWEVERLLNEVEELPQILLMENVPQVHSEGDNRMNFKKWLEYLESKGYHSDYYDMNASDYGIPQNRERCFCLSWLGDYTFRFPQKIPLRFNALQLLDEKVDKKYFMTGERKEILLDNYIKQNETLTDRQTDRGLLTETSTIQRNSENSTRLPQNNEDVQSMSRNQLVLSKDFRGKNKENCIVKETEVLSTILSSSSDGMSNFGTNMVVKND